MITQVINSQRIANAQAVGQAATAYTDPIKAMYFFGFMALLVTSSAGSITITQQCSKDGNVWYDPVDQDGNALGAVVSAMTVGTKYIQFSPVIAKHIRFKIVEGNSAATVVTADLTIQEGI